MQTETAAKTERNLTAALSLMGITHKPSAISGKRDWFADDGEFLGTFDAHDGWAKIRELGSQVEAERSAS